MQNIRIYTYSQDIEMEFGIEKCAMLIMKRGRRGTTEGIEPQNQKSIKTLGEKRKLQESGNWKRISSNKQR